MLTDIAHRSHPMNLYAFGRPGFLRCAAVSAGRSLCTQDLGCRAWRCGPRPSGAFAALRVRRATLWLGRVLSQIGHWLPALAGWLFLPPRGSVLGAGSVSVDTFSSAHEPAVAVDERRRVIGVTLPCARPATKHRLGFTVVPVSVSAVRTRLTAALGGDGQDMHAMFEALPAEDLVEAG